MDKSQKSELDIWLAFYLCKGMGIQRALSLLEQVEIYAIPLLSKHALQQYGLPIKVAEQFIATDWHKVNYLTEKCIKQSIHIIYYTHRFYPSQLKQIHSAPMILFCLGDVELLNTPQLAVVGSRNATQGGLQTAKDITTQLWSYQITVTSGLALGIDSAAHQGALAANGKTIAVLGTGVDVIYPKRNFKLYQQIKEQGLLISEFLPGTAALSKNFPKRNRIISGLSLGCIVVEAEIKSGSLVSAKYALEQNREVFAVPGSIFNPLSSGCHALIKQGAKLIENIDDILQELSIFEKNCLYNYRETENKEEIDPLLDAVGYEVTSVDTVAARSGLAITEVLNQLLDLELSGKVERVLDGYIRLGRS